MSYSADWEQTQKRLIKMGFDVGEDGADGYPGEYTNDAVNDALDFVEAHMPTELPTETEVPESNPTDYPADNYQLSQDFKLKEFYYHGQRMPIENIPYFKILCDMILQPFRGRINNKARELGILETHENTIGVTSSSGYRPPPKDGYSMHDTAAADFYWNYDILPRHIGQCILIDMYYEKSIGGLGISAKAETREHGDPRHVLDYVNGKFIWCYGSKYDLHKEVIAKLKQYGYWDNLLEYK